jgi:hypothetical protein
MKRDIKVFLIAAFLLIAPVLMFAQTPPHPNGGAVPSGSNTPVGAGAPVGNGIFILLTLALAYAGRKVYDVRCEKEVE